MPDTLRSLLCLVLLGLSQTSLAHAQHLVHLRIDNDTFAGVDRWYTSRLELNTALAWQRFGRSLVLFRLGLGQVMYTSRNIQRREAPTRDHAFGGWLYVDLAATLRGPRFTAQLGLRAGIIGPYAGAEPVQEGTHALLGVRTPRGWSNQLDHQPGGMLRGVWAVHPRHRIDGLDLVPIGGLQVDAGNVHGRVVLALGLAIGHGVPASLLASSFGPELTTGSRCARVCAAAYLGGRGQGVWHDLFVGARGAGVRPAIEARRGIGELSGGFIVGGRRAWLRYTHVRQSRSFDNGPRQRRHPRQHRYGMLEIGAVFGAP